MKTAAIRKATALILTLVMLMTCAGAWATTETTTVVVNADTEDEEVTVEAIEVIEVTPDHDRTVGLEVSADGYEAVAEVEEGIVAEGENNPGEFTQGTAGIVMEPEGEGSKVEAKVGDEGVSVKDTRTAVGIDINMSDDSVAEAEVAGSVEATAESPEGESSSAVGVAIDLGECGNSDVNVEISGNIDATGDTHAVGLGFGTAAGPTENNTAEVHVDGDINAKTVNGDQNTWDGATGINAEGIAGTAEVTVDGSVNAAGQKKATAVSAWTSEEEDVFEIAVGEDINATADKNATAVKTDVIDGTVSVMAGDDITATAGLMATGVEATAQGGTTVVTAGGDITAEGVSTTTAVEAIPYDGSVTVNAGGNVTATSSFNATAITATPNKGSVEVNVAGQVTADAQTDAAGVWSIPAQGDVTVNIGGDVTANSKEDEFSHWAYGIYGDVGEGASLTVHVGGGVTAATAGEDSNGSGVDLTLHGARAEVNISEDVKADNFGVKMRVGNEDDDRENSAASEGKVTVDGSIEVAGRGDSYQGRSGVRVDNYHEKAAAEVEVGGDIKITDEDWASAIDVTAGSGLVKVKTGGDISAISEGYSGKGVTAMAEKNGEAQVDVGGSVYAAAEDQSSGVDAVALEAGAKVKITVAAGITAKSLTDEGEASGILAGNYVKDGASGEVDIRVNGDVNADFAGIETVGSGWEEKSLEGTAEVREEDYLRTEYFKDEGGEIVGYKVYYNAEGDYYYNENGDMMRPEEAESGLTRIEVRGDVTGGDFGLKMNSRAITDVIVDGTLTGGESAVVLADEKMADNLTLTVWEIKPNEDGILAGVGGLNEEGGYDIEQMEDFEKQIQYIIRVKQPKAGATLSTEGTFDHEGYDVAYEGDNVILKIDLQPGYEIVDACNGTDTKVSLMKDEKGQYYLVVPRGGAVLLSVKLRRVETAPTEPTRTETALSKTCKITVDPNGGTLKGSTEPIVETVGRYQSFTLPEAPEKKGEAFLGWYGTPFTAADANWKAPEEGSAKLLPAGSSVKVTRDYCYTAVWKAE